MSALAPGMRVDELRTTDDGTEEVAVAMSNVMKKKHFGKQILSQTQLIIAFSLLSMVVWVLVLRAVVVASRSTE